MQTVPSSEIQSSKFTQPTNQEVGKKPYTLKIPCKSYIKKYVASLYGSPVKIENRTMLGIFLLAVLDKRTYEKRNFGPNQTNKGIEDTILVEVNNWQFNAIGFDVSAECVMIINDFLEHMFDDSLYVTCFKNSKYKSRKTGYRAIMEGFCKRHGIELELDISYEALKKKEYRYRKQIQKNEEK